MNVTLLKDEETFFMKITQKIKSKMVEDHLFEI